jgi:hypothetical protein
MIKIDMKLTGCFYRLGIQRDRSVDRGLLPAGQLRRALGGSDGTVLSNL